MVLDKEAESKYARREGKGGLCFERTQKRTPMIIGKYFSIDSKTSNIYLGVILSVLNVITFTLSLIRTVLRKM